MAPTQDCWVWLKVQQIKTKSLVFSFVDTGLTGHLRIHYEWIWWPADARYYRFNNMQSADIASTVTLLDGSGGFSNIHDLCCFIWCCGREKRSCVISCGGFCSFLKGYVIGNNVHDIALGQSLNGGIDTMLFEDLCISLLSCSDGAVLNNNCYCIFMRALG